MLGTQRFFKVPMSDYKKGDFVNLILEDKSLQNHSKFSDYAVLAASIDEIRTNQFVMSLPDDPTARVIPKTLIDAPRSHNFTLNSTVFLYVTRDGRIFHGSIQKEPESVNRVLERAKTPEKLVSCSVCEIKESPSSIF